MPVARLGGCRLCVGGLPRTSSVREPTGTTSRCVGGGCVCLPALSPCFLISICVMSVCMCSGGNLMRLVRWGGVLTWRWGRSPCVLCAKRDLVCCVWSWCSRYAPSMFSNSHRLNVHGHGWWGWHDACGVLGRVQTVRGGASPHKLCEGGHRDHKSGCWRRMYVPACAKPMFSSSNMPHVRARA